MNRYDQQLAVFIRKHASAAAIYCDVAVLCILSDPKQKEMIEFEERNEYNVKSLVVYFKKYSSILRFIDPIVNLFRYLHATKEGLERMRDTFGNHDVTHAYIMLRPALTAYWLRYATGKPFVISEQWSGYATGKFNKLSFNTKVLSRWVFKKANAVTAVSAFLKNKMIECGLNNKNFEITNNVIEKFPKTTSPLPQNDKIKILVVADLKDEIKNISGIIRAMNDIKSPDTELHIIGHGDDERMLKNLANELNLLGKVVFFHGVKLNEEVFQYLHACDFLVMNSRFETFSLICAEALSCGKPVIATRCGGPQEYVTKEAGILIEPDSPEELKRAMITMIESYRGYNPETLKNIVSSSLSLEKIGATFHSIYRNIRNK